MHHLVEEYIEAEHQFKRMSDLVEQTMAKLAQLCELRVVDDEETPDDDDDGDFFDTSAEKDHARTKYDGTVVDWENGEDQKLQVPAILSGLPAVESDDSDDFDQPSGFTQSSNKAVEFPETAKSLYKKVAQKAHPDRLMRFSATAKQNIVDEYHEAQKSYESSNVPRLALCLVKVMYYRNDSYRLLQHKAVYENVVYGYLNFILDATREITSAPYMRAINLYQMGHERDAVLEFKRYMRSQGIEV